jgi:hypothetical protein
MKKLIRIAVLMLGLAGIYALAAVPQTPTADGGRGIMLPPIVVNV